MAHTVLGADAPMVFCQKFFELRKLRFNLPRCGKIMAGFNCRFFFWKIIPYEIFWVGFLAGTAMGSKGKGKTQLVFIFSEEKKEDIKRPKDFWVFGMAPNWKNFMGQENPEKKKYRITFPWKIFFGAKKNEKILEFQWPCYPRPCCFFQLLLGKMGFFKTPGRKFPPKWKKNCLLKSPKSFFGAKKMGFTLGKNLGQKNEIVKGQLPLAGVPPCPPFSNCLEKARRVEKLKLLSRFQPKRAPFLFKWRRINEEMVGPLS